MIRLRKSLFLSMLFLTMISLLGCTQEQSSKSGILEPLVSSAPPDLSGIWQTMNTASWNLEGHIASKMPVTNILGALGGIPAGMSVVEGGEITYLPEAHEKIDQNRTD